MPNGVYDSQVRVYLAPTLTQQLGMAICFGPQSAGKALPAPFNAISGNCIVTKIPGSTASCDVNDPYGDDILSDTDLHDLAEFGICTRPLTSGASGSSSSSPTSPLQMVSLNNGVPSNAFPSGLYF